jgi:hypothetical protein
LRRFKTKGETRATNANTGYHGKWCSTRGNPAIILPSTAGWYPAKICASWRRKYEIYGLSTVKPNWSRRGVLPAVKYTHTSVELIEGSCVSIPRRQEKWFYLDGSFAEMSFFGYGNFMSGNAIMGFPFGQHWGKRSALTDP